MESNGPKHSFLEDVQAFFISQLQDIIILQDKNCISYDYKKNKQKKTKKLNCYAINRYILQY